MKINWGDYSFVVRGKQRRMIILLMDRGKTPTELKRESGLNFNNVSRVLVQFEKNKLTEPPINNGYMATADFGARQGTRTPA